MQFGLLRMLGALEPKPLWHIFDPAIVPHNHSVFFAASLLT